MEYRRFENAVYLRVDRGEEIVACLKEVCRRERIALASVSGIGAVDDFTVGIFLYEEGRYQPTRYRGEHEILSLLGSVTQKEGEPYLHLHMSAAGADGVAKGGHLSEARVSVTGEIVLTLTDGRIGRTPMNGTPVNLFDFS